MKLNPSAAYQAYNKISERNVRPVRRPELPTESAPQRVQHTDQVQISAEGARSMEVQQLSRSIMSQIKAPASAQRLESLRSAIAGGNYHVATSDLVDAVVRQWYAE